MFRVEMKFNGDANWYPYGTYETRDRANEVAVTVREERGCEVWIEEV